MKTRQQDFALGLTAIVFLVLFVATIVFLASAYRGATQTIVVHFRQEAGLAPIKPGSPVLLSGAIDVGQVTKVEPREITVESPRGPQRRAVIVVEAEIDRAIRLYGNCEITTDMPLVGGSGTLVIANIGTPDVPLTDRPIEGLPPQGLAAFSAVSRRLTAEGGLVDRLDRMLDPEADGSLLNKVMQSLADVNAVTGELRTQLSVAEQRTLLGKIHRILDDLSATSTALREQMRADNAAGVLAKVNAGLDVLHHDLSELRTLLAENRPVLHSTLTRIEHTARVVDDELIAGLRAEFDPRSSTSLLGKLHVAMDRVNASLADIQAMSDAGQRVLVLNRPQIEAILGNLKEMSAELTQASKELRLNPSKLIWGPPEPQKGKLDIFMAARDFAQAATLLDDAAARLQAILQVRPAGTPLADTDQEVHEIYESLRGAFERFQRAEAFFWDQMK